MSHEAQARSDAENSPAHAGKGHLVGNILVFVLMFGMLLLGMYLLTWLTLDTVWPMTAIIVLSFLAFFIPQGIIGRADTGHDLAEGNRTAEKEPSAGVSS